MRVFVPCSDRETVQALFRYFNDASYNTVMYAYSMAAYGVKVRDGYLVTDSRDVTDITHDSILGDFEF